MKCKRCPFTLLCFGGVVSPFRSEDKTFCVKCGRRYFPVYGANRNAQAVLRCVDLPEQEQVSARTLRKCALCAAKLTRNGKTKRKKLRSKKGRKARWVAQFKREPEPFVFQLDNPAHLSIFKRGGFQLSDAHGRYPSFRTVSRPLILPKR